MPRPLMVLIFAAAGLACLIAIMLSRSAENPPRRRPTVTASPSRITNPKPPPLTEETLRDSIHRLEVAVSGGNRDKVVSWARKVRQSLIEKPSLLKEASLILGDPAHPPALRAALAVVLGSLPGDAGKQAVLDALKRGVLTGLERTALLSLGIAEVEDGDEFERGGQPFAVEAAPGLSVFVRGPVSIAEARAELARRLSDSASAADRLASARVLCDSTGFPEVRQALLDRLGSESDAETTAEAAAALGQWAREAKPDDSERMIVLAKIFDTLPGSEEVVRFRLVTPIATTRLRADEAARLRSLASADDGDTRHFAVETIGRRMGLSTDEDREAAPLLSKVLAEDGDADVREAAALALGRAVSAAPVVEALAKGLAQDPDWEVRAAAARSLGNARDSAVAREALRVAALHDEREEVRNAAGGTLIPAPETK